MNGKTPLPAIIIQVEVCRRALCTVCLVYRGTGRCVVRLLVTPSEADRLQARCTTCQLWLVGPSSKADLTGCAR